MDAILTKKDGKVSMDKSFDYLCSLLKNGVYVVNIKKKIEPRTVSQNALLWMWLQCLEDYSGQPKQDWHDYYCAKFLRRVVNIRGMDVSVIGGTKTLNTVQMTRFLNQVQADAAAEEGVQLPLPADQYYREFIEEYRDR